ncbi:probable tetraacyldisaccharide 4'-kinase, mitochondrial [Zingiber officinale]|uniref:probable tetraacyldisaccharide 4'-kinase, mitochondrial n=1 Tax=Zingiber officinale TaxID=94328 RepID=UPI001C4B7DF4|nr:probable tetraacyldisaccharide 4'-kinase, mitochondrial [Zingiber officinale]
MERLKTAVAQIAATTDSRLRELPLLHRSLLLPLLSLASSLYRHSLALRRRVYALGLLSRQRLPVPVISVGNLTWGGNGKTPMVEFIARIFLEAGISPLILTRGYAGGDEVKMIQRHLAGTPTRIGVGANRSATAASIFRQHGYMKFNSTLFAEQLSSTQHLRLASGNDKVAVAILDDGMQHWSLSRDVEMVMINGLIPWGNNHLLPRGSLREPLDALCRADITVIHHADLLSEGKLKMIETKIRIIDPCSTIFFSRLAPSHFFEVKNQHSILPLGLVLNRTVLCVSGIGSPCAFAQVVGKIGPSYVDRLDFDDHHSIQFHDIKLIKERLEELANRFREKIIVVVTEKDYDRDPLILTELHDFDVLVLCCSLHIMTTKGQSEESFKIKLKELLISKHGG